MAQKDFDRIVSLTMARSQGAIDYPTALELMFEPWGRDKPSTPSDLVRRGRSDLAQHAMFEMADGLLRRRSRAHEVAAPLVRSR